MQDEVIGTVINILPEQLDMFASIPSLPDEQEEYSIILKRMQDIVPNSSLPYRQRCLLAKDWEHLVKIPSCWLSFQYIKKSDCEYLIAVMRSCSVAILASDLGFVAKLAKAIAEQEAKMQVILLIGSLHVV